MAQRNKTVVFSSAKSVSEATQKKVRRHAIKQTRNIVVVRTTAGDFVGCLVFVGLFSIRLVIFTGFDRVFRVIRIPRRVIFDIFRFPCN